MIEGDHPVIHTLGSPPRSPRGLLTSPVERCRGRPARAPRAGTPSPLVLRRARRPRRRAPRTAPAPASGPGGISSCPQPPRTAATTPPAAAKPQIMTGFPKPQKPPPNHLTTRLLRWCVLTPRFPGGKYTRSLRRARTGRAGAARRRRPGHVGRIRVVLVGTAEAPDPREESEAERADRNLAELLQELRVAGLGVQVLFGFLLSLPFTSRFSQLSPG